MSELVDIDALRQLMAKATAGDLTTAESHTESAYVECPACHGDGEIEATDYCNFDGKALGVQFYGIGPEFGAHEALWRAVMSDLPSLLNELEALRASHVRMVELAKAIDLARNTDARSDWIRVTKLTDAALASKPGGEGGDGVR